MMVAHNEMVTVLQRIHGIEVAAGPLPSPSGRDNGTWSGVLLLRFRQELKTSRGLWISLSF